MLYFWLSVPIYYPQLLCPCLCIIEKFVLLLTLTIFLLYLIYFPPYSYMPIAKRFFIESSHWFYALCLVSSAFLHLSIITSSFFFLSILSWYFSTHLITFSLYILIKDRLLYMNNSCCLRFTPLKISKFNKLVIYKLDFSIVILCLSIFWVPWGVMLFIPKQHEFSTLSGVASELLGTPIHHIS